MEEVREVQQEAAEGRRGHHRAAVAATRSFQEEEGVNCCDHRRRIPEEAAANLTTFYCDVLNDSLDLMLQKKLHFATAFFLMYVKSVSHFFCKQNKRSLELESVPCRAG